MNPVIVLLVPCYFSQNKINVDSEDSLQKLTGCPITCLVSTEIFSHVLVVKAGEKVISIYFMP